MLVRVVSRRWNCKSMTARGRRPRYAHQLFSILFDDEISTLFSWIGTRFYFRSNRDQPATRLEKIPGFVQGFSTHGIEDHIDYACLFKRALPIIDDLIGSKLLYKIDVRLGRRGNHMCSSRFCKLNCKKSHRPSPSVYKDSFAFL